MFLADEVHKWWLGYDVKAQYRRLGAPRTKKAPQ
jgi:hypothetical protein